MGTPNKCTCPKCGNKEALDISGTVFCRCMDYNETIPEQQELFSEEEWEGS